MAVSIGPKLGIDGESEYRKQINLIIQQAKTLKSEMDAVASSFTKETTAEEKNRATKAVLTKQIEAQEQKTKLLAHMVEESAKATGENSNETLKWKEQLNKATAELGKMNRQMENLDDSLDDTGDGFDDNQKAAKKFGDELDDAKITAADFGDILRANILSDVIVSGFQKLADYAKDFASGTIEAAANANALASQMEQTFGALKGEADAAIGRVAKNSGILETRLQGAAAQIYAFARSSGGDAKESLQLMETALQAAADSAAYYDKSLDDTVETMQSFLKGNFANDAALGLSATETTRNAAATKLFRKEYNKLTEIQKQKVLLSMVTDAQKLSGAMGQAAREADGWENVQGNLNETVKQFQAQVGKPVLKNLIPIVQTITEKFSAWQKSINWTKFNEQVSSAFDYLLTNGPKIVKTVGAIGGSFLAIDGGIKIVNGLASAGKTLVAILGAGGGAVGVVGAAAAAALGIGMLISATQDETNATYLFNKAEKDRISAMNQLRDTYQAVADSAAKKSQEEYAEIAHVQNLAKELDLLVDANGKVDEANRTRVSFILGELSDALGTEYRMTGDQIKGYETLQEKVQNLVKTKQAEILLEEANAKYTESLAQKSEVEKNLYDQRLTLIQREKEAKEAEGKLNKFISENGVKYNDSEFVSLQWLVSGKKNAYDETLKAYNNFSAQYDQINKDIQAYETASAELMQGHAEKTIEILDRQSQGFRTAQSVAQLEAEEQRKILDDQYAHAEGILEIYKEKYRAGVEGYTKEGLALLEKNAADAKTEAEKIGTSIVSGVEQGFTTQTPGMQQTVRNTLTDISGKVKTDSEDIGKNIAKGTEKGLTKEAPNMKNRVRSIYRDVTGAIKKDLGIASPSKVFAEIGKFTAEGYTIGLEKTMAKDMRSIQSAFELSADVATAAATPQPVTYATTEYGGFTINVNAAPGQSEEAIADAVSARIQQQINQREAVW